MEKEHHDYSVFLAIIAIWIMIGAFAQCDSAERLDDIRQELGVSRSAVTMVLCGIHKTCKGRKFIYG